MYFSSLDSVTERDVQQLATDRIPETLTLEFKQQLNLDRDEDRREAAKDCSAFANTVGGQILYGISERNLPDGSKVAGPITPLTEGNIDERLGNVLASAIQPPPRPRMVKVPVTGGFVLTVEILPSSLDLYMVTAYNEARYYRRDERAVRRMTEPEIREAYARITLLRGSLDERLGRLISPELSIRSATDESLIIAPWHSSANLLDPRVVGREVGREIADGPLNGVRRAETFADLRLGADGWHLILPDNALVEGAPFYAAVFRNGVIHVSENDALNFTSGKRDALEMSSFLLLYRINSTLMAAQYIYEKARYWSDARILYVLRPAVPLFIDPGRRIGARSVAARVYQIGPVDMSLRQAGKRLGQIVKPLLDQVFQIGGEPVSPFFTDDGRLRDEYRGELRGRMAEYLS
jgi:hypothetical protein